MLVSRWLLVMFISSLLLNERLPFLVPLVKVQTCVYTMYTMYTYGNILQYTVAY